MAGEWLLNRTDSQSTLPIPIRTSIRVFLTLWSRVVTILPLTTPGVPPQTRLQVRYNHHQTCNRKDLYLTWEIQEPWLTQWMFLPSSRRQIWWIWPIRSKAVKANTLFWLINNKNYNSSCSSSRLSLVNSKSMASMVRLEDLETICTLPRVSVQVLTKEWLTTEKGTPKLGFSRGRTQIQIQI